jgi:hypothetical protein
MSMRVTGWVLLGLLAICLAPRSEAQGYPPGPGRFGAVLEVAGEFGGDNLVKVFYDNGDTQDLKAGQGVTLSAGLHYEPRSVPIDFAATVGYKFVRTSDFNTDLGINRVVFKVTGTYALPNHFWVDAGPVVHTATKVNGDGYLPDIKFDDSVGATVGFGWRWFGLTYTHITYSSAVTRDVDASNVGVIFTYKFDNGTAP